jgi:hypothetical protein
LPEGAKDLFDITKIKERAVRNFDKIPFGASEIIEVGLQILLSKDIGVSLLGECERREGERESAGSRYQVRSQLRQRVEKSTFGYLHLSQLQLFGR